MALYTVTYNPNGGTGNVPATAQYVNGTPVTVLGNTGGLTKTNATFAYWNSAKNGSGTVYGSGVVFNILGSITLYAQWYVTAGLHHHGVTEHYAFAYDSVLAAGGLEPARTKALMAAAEKDYKLMSDWFGVIGLSVSLPLHVNVANESGGAHTGQTVTLKPGSGDANYCRYLLVSEVTELFMDSQQKGWFSPDGSGEQSCGEGLSRFLAQQFLVWAGIGISEPDYAISPSWLNSSLPSTTAGSTQLGPQPLTSLSASINAAATSLSVVNAPSIPFAATYVIQIGNEQMLVTAVNQSANTLIVTRGHNSTAKAAHSAKAQVFQNYGSRADYVNLTLEYDHGIDAATGCAMLFLYYLHVQLCYSIDDIIAKAPGISHASNCLRGVYRNLTGDDGDPFPFFKELLDKNFPRNQVSTIPGPNPDNPYPLGAWGGLGGLSGCVGDMDGDGIDEILVSSSWGIGILKKSGHTMTSLATAANGSKLGEWLLDTDSNRFGPVADFDFDGRDEIFVVSPWGVGILKFKHGTWSTIVMCANGTDLGGVTLNTVSDQFGPVFDYDGGNYLIFYAASTGVGSLALEGGLHAQSFYTFGTNIFGWTLTAFDKFGPFGCFLGSNYGANPRTQFVVTNASGLAVIETSGGQWSAITAIADGATLKGGWVLHTAEDQFLLGGRYQYNPPPMDLILVVSSWGIGTLWFGLDPGFGLDPSPPTLVTGWRGKNGTDMGGWTSEYGRGSVRPRRVSHHQERRLRELHRVHAGLCDRDQSPRYPHHRRRHRRRIVHDDLGSGSQRCQPERLGPRYRS